MEEDENKYWTVQYDGNILSFTDYRTNFDISNKEIGNYFKTKKEAEEYLEDLKVKTKIKDIAKELNGYKEINWHDCSQDKYFLIYNYDDSEALNAKYNHECAWKLEGTTHCLDKNFADECIKRIGIERLENYLKRR